MDDADLKKTFELAERTFGSHGVGSTSSPLPAAADGEGVGERLRGMLWRLGGRRLPRSAGPITQHLASLLEGTERELAGERERHAFDVSAVREQANAELRSVREQAAAEMAAVLQRHAAELAAVREGQERLKAELDATLGREQADARQRHIAEFARLRQDHAEEIGRLAQAAEVERARAAARIAELEAEVGRRAVAETHRSRTDQQSAQLRDEMVRDTTRLREGHQQELARAFSRISQLEGELARLGSVDDALRMRQGLERDLVRAGMRIAELETALKASGSGGERAHADERRLREEMARDAARQRDSHQRELARALSRIGDLEGELARRPASGDGGWEERASRAEADLRMAENKIELLKDALDAARARVSAAAARTPAPVAPPVADGRFREAKRAFARLFHPDQGGRGVAEREKLFLDFWPVLERIERGEG
ncbi:MAG: hypothetical protein HY985_04600 [Magnetospirillum sp.]|nr:hypothetical protein [Magnetospirillum sp.]